MILPYSVECENQRLPWANLLIFAACAVVHVGVFGGFFSREVVEAMVLTGWNPKGLIGCMFLHTGHVHFAGNMFFLIVFGNALCRRIGNFRYLALYFLTGLAASASHLIIDGRPMAGASGAIAGVFGLCLVVMPLAGVSCIYCFGLHYAGKFTIPCIVVQLIWGVGQIASVVFMGEGMIAYWAHLGGFFGGIAIGTAILMLHMVSEDRDESETIIAMFRGPQKYRAKRKKYVRNDGVPYALGQRGVSYVPGQK